MQISEAIARVIGGGDLTQDEVAEVFGHIMDGTASAAQIGGLLVALRMKGETADEIAGAARAMRQRAKPFNCPEREIAVDTCGTGGDGAGTVNISTMAALVVAAAGGRVAKHGNRAQSSRAGSADVLEALGVGIDAPVDVIERCLAEARIGFLFAPSFHAATRHAAGPRKDLATRTIFNLIGPLTNPAQVGCQVVGVFDARWCEPVARALGSLGVRRALVVHGASGLDEIAVRGPTRVADWDAARGEVVLGEISPADFGLEEEDPAGLKGGDALENAAAVRRVLAGEIGAMRTATLMTASAALVACGRAADYRVGAEMAAAAIGWGEATRILDLWIKLSGGTPGSEVKYQTPGDPQGGTRPWRTTKSILGDIVRFNLAKLASAKAERPIAELEARAREQSPPRPFAAALRRPPGAPVRAIAEIKRASPSVGPIRPGADPVAIAREYAAAGAAAISVLTDERFFDGRMEFMNMVREAVPLPVLRKDFLIDPYQLVESRAYGADAVLLIAAAVSPAQLRELLQEAGRLGMDALVEVISEAEADVALAAGARLVGVNHRDLRNFTVDMGLTKRLATRVPRGVVLVAESGIRTPEDVCAMGDYGADAVLVGEALMRAPSPGAALAELMTA